MDQVKSKCRWRYRRANCYLIFGENIQFSCRPTQIIQIHTKPSRGHSLIHIFYIEHNFTILSSVDVSHNCSPTSTLSILMSHVGNKWMFDKLLNSLISSHVADTPTSAHFSIFDSQVVISCSVRSSGRSYVPHWLGMKRDSSSDTFKWIQTQQEVRTI